MRKYCLSVLVLLGILLWAGPAVCAQSRTVHVLVALCDNKYQGIVPVPAKIGNGQDPFNNLYWGAAFGVKTFFGKQPEWTHLGTVKNPAPHILERAIFFCAAKNITLVADAYDGQYIKECTEKFFQYAAGRAPEKVTSVSAPGKSEKSVAVGSDADLLVYIGHDGLMDFTLPRYPARVDATERPVAVFACMSERFFLPGIDAAGAKPLVLTTNLMCPEAYTTHALVMAWADGASPVVVRKAVSAAYAKYQKCSLPAATRMFTGAGK